MRRRPGGTDPQIGVPSSTFPSARGGREDGETAQPPSEQPALPAKVLARRPDGSILPSVIVTLSPDGCRIECPAPLQPGDNLQIAIQGDAIDAIVRWFSNGNAGLSFFWDRSSSTESRTGTTRSDEVRAKAEIQATMQRHGKPRYPVIVSDMSIAGCKVEYVDRPDVGERVHMRLPGLEPIEGMVRWVAGAEAGIHFERPIHPAVFELLLRRSIRR